MNLDTLTPAQRDCVTHVQGPLLVSAGAGSGKTLMLTQRIAYALLNPQESGVDDIDQVLAITFTALAASEIKARVRNRLREEGLAVQALKVDASWIGTIHGMCSRILHESALDLGIDPQFGLLDDTDRDQLLEACVNEALAEVRGAAGGDGEDGDGFLPGVLPAYDALFREYEKADGPSNVGTMASALINAAANVRGGLDAVACAPVASPHDIVRDVLGAMESCDAAARTGIGTNGKAKETFTVKARDVLEDPVWGMPAFERLAARRDCAYDDVACALLGVDLSFGSRTSKEPYATAYALFRAAYIQACSSCGLGLAEPARTQLLALARRVQELFDSAKARRGVLDKNDLLVKTLEAFEGCPEVAARYQDRFRLVMVDEFQDTSGLQIALISHLTDGDRRLCTVGDTQQSIYRFRGADVATYRAHKRAMRGHEGQGGLYRELDMNFRSHCDIIAFVNRVFGAPEVFGDNGEFIHLGALASHAEKNPFPDVPRIDVVATTSAHGGGVSTDDRHLVEAEAVARRLEALHADAPNQRWGDMVLLLGTMKRAAVYADTLRAHGVPCIVAGGSGFSWTPEAQEVGALLEAVADPWDDANLRAALCGAAFGLGAEELLRLGATPAGGRRHLWEGLLEAGAGDSSSRVRLAASLLADAVARGAARGAAATLTELAVSSGWLERLQGRGPQGMASAANVLKAIRLAESIEGEDTRPRGIPATAERLALKLAEGMKEKPGSLMVDGQDAVRIMTIHASKGLEFPIVALADFYGLRAETDRLRLETAGDTVYLSLLPSASTAVGAPFEGLLGTELTEKQAERLQGAGYFELFDTPGLDEARDAHELHRAIRAHNIGEELGELRRKFYVGATRPREALVVAVNMAVSKKGPFYGDVLDDLRRGLFGEMGDFVTAPEGIDFGGLRRAACERIEVARDAAGGLLVNGEPAAGYLSDEMVPTEGEEGFEVEQAVFEAVPESPRPGEHLSDLAPGKRPCDPLRAGRFSYSGIAPHPAAGADAGAAGAQNDAGAADECDPDELAGAAGIAGLVEAASKGEDQGVEVAAEVARTEAEKERRAQATAFGSALHQACQLMAESFAARRAAGDTGAVPAAPNADAVTSCMRTWGVPSQRQGALEGALARWAGSDAAREAFAHQDIVPEAPFLVTILGMQGEPLHLDGSIDLLCHDHDRPPAEQAALVVDYKTGGSVAETPEELRAKHALQAACYAYAVLSCGYAAVDLRFVRVQQRDPARPDQPQAVSYRYERAQLQELQETIRAAYAEARRVVGA